MYLFILEFVIFLWFVCTPWLTLLFFSTRILTLLYAYLNTLKSQRIIAQSDDIFSPFLDTYQRMCEKIRKKKTKTTETNDQISIKIHN